MKLRQKLAAVMAAAMVVTAVPVVTMADTSNAVRNVNQILKNTEMGYSAESDMTEVVTEADGVTTRQVTNASYVNLNNSSNPEYTKRYIPAFEFVPKANYETGAQKQSFFISLSENTNFNDKAFLTAINIAAYYGTTLNNSSDLSVNATFNSYEAFESQNASGMTIIGKKKLGLIFDKDGKVVQSNISAWYGKTVDEIMDANPTLTIYHEGDNTKELTIQHISDLNVTENEKTYKSTIRVDVKGRWNQGDVVKVPLLAKAGGDEVIVKVDGLDSFISSGTYVITGKLTDKKLTATAASNTLTTDAGEIGKITLAESQIGSSDVANRFVRIELPSNSDLEFVASSQPDKSPKGVASPVTATVTGARGFHGQEATVNVYYDKQYRGSQQDDTKAIIIELPNFTDNTARGEYVLSGIKVMPEGKLAQTGEVNVTVSEFTGKLANDTEIASNNLLDKTTLKVAEVKDYEVTLTCEKPAQIKAGRSGLVNKNYSTFILKESVKDSLVDSRKIEFRLENGYIFGPADVTAFRNSTSNSDVDYTYTSKTYAQAAEAYFKQLVADKVILLEDKAEGAELSNLDLDIDAEGRVYGFTARFPKLDPAKADTLKITLPVATDVQSTGDVTLKVSNLYTRYTEKDEVSAVIANIIAPIEVALDKAAIKVGLQGQEAGKITIKETDKGMLERGWLFLSAADVEGITFAKVPTITTSPSDNSGLTIKNVALSKDKQVVAFEITKTSKEAATIEISDLVFTTDRTVPEANYDLQIWGTALTDENELDFTNFTVTQNVLNSNSYKNQTTDTYVVKDFIQMTTPNTEDIKNGALKAVTSVFTLDSEKYTVDGVEYTMDAKAYAEDGRTMIPVRYVAKAFGIDESNVLYANQVATIIAGEKIIQVTMGSNILTVNGAQIQMDTKAVVKEGRAYVPMKFIAAALGVDVSYDASAKTATFSNKK